MYARQARGAAGTARSGNYENVGISGEVIPRHAAFVKARVFSRARAGFIAAVNCTPSLTATEKRVAWALAFYSDKALWRASGLLVTRIDPRVVAAEMAIQRAEMSAAIWHLRSLGLIEAERVPRCGRLLKHLRIRLIDTKGQLP
jgi:hypothetical protein